MRKVAEEYLEYLYTDEGQTIAARNFYRHQLEKSLAWIPKDRTLVTVSNDAGRGGRAADLLAAKGFKVAGTVGAQTYEQDGGKIAHIPAPVTAAKN